MNHPRVQVCLDLDDLNAAQVNVQAHGFACGHLAVVRFGHLTLTSYGDATAHDMAAAFEQIAFELRHAAEEFHGVPMGEAA